MRKFLLTLFIAQCAIVATFAKDEFKLFVPDAQGIVSVTKMIPTSKSEDEVVKLVIKSLCEEDGNIEKVSDNLYRGIFQTQSYINPFSGSTRRSLKLSVNIVVADGVATLTFTDLYMLEVYAGYGLHEKNINLSDKMTEYFAAKKMVTEKSGSKKEINEAKDIIENVEDDIYPTEEEFAKRLSNAERALR